MACLPTDPCHWLVCLLAVPYISTLYVSRCLCPLRHYLRALVSTSSLQCVFLAIHNWRVYVRQLSSQNSLNPKGVVMPGTTILTTTSTPGPATVPSTTPTKVPWWWGRWCCVYVMPVSSPTPPFTVFLSCPFPLPLRRSLYFCHARFLSNSSVHCVSVMPVSSPTPPFTVFLSCPFPLPPRRSLCFCHARFLSHSAVHCVSVMPVSSPTPPFTVFLSCPFPLPLRRSLCFCHARFLSNSSVHCISVMPVSSPTPPFTVFLSCLFPLPLRRSLCFCHARFLVVVVESTPSRAWARTGSQTPARGPPSFSPHTSSSASTPTGSVHKSQTVSVVGMSGQLKRCNESWFGSLQSGQFAAGWLAGSILCR